MDRRDFTRHLLGAAAGLTGAAAPWSALGRTPAPAARSIPWPRAFDGLQADVPRRAMALRGRVPAALAGGVLLRNGPARHQLGDVRYSHWFDGDGMIQRYAFGSQCITHEGRFVQTPKFVAESAAGRWLEPAFGTHPKDAPPPPSPDEMNVANTHIVAHGGELLALWEGGSAMKLDADTLDARGFKTWAPDYAGMPFSAHPRVEPDGTLWSFGVSSGAGVLSIYRVSADGRDVETHSLKVPDIGMLHDFAVTGRHLVFLLPPFVYDIERAKAGETFLGSHVWRRSLGMRVLLLPKDELDAPRWLQLPAGFVFHLGNAWEDAQGIIRLDYVRSPDATLVLQGARDLMRGAVNGNAPAARVACVRLDPASGNARQEELPLDAEFPRIDPRRTGRRYRHVYPAERVDAPLGRPLFDSVTRLDVDTGRVQRHRYGAGVLAEEHVFVPRPGSAREGEGWLIGSALDLQRGRLLCSVFDAEHLADGPIAQGHLERVMPMGLHASFIRRT